MSFDNALPMNLEAEQAILGGIIKDPTCHASREVMDVLDASMFYQSTNGYIFQTVCHMAEVKRDVCLITVTTELDRLGRDYGGFAYIAEMIRSVISLANLGSYAELVKEAHTAREVVRISQIAMESARTEDATNVIEQLTTNLSEITSTNTGKGLTHLSELSSRWLDLLEARCSNPGNTYGLATGIGGLDERLGGIDEQSLVVLAGRPSMGKTLMAQCICQNVGIYAKGSTEFYSMEMGDMQIMDRFVCGITGIEPKKLKQGDLTDADWGSVSQALSDINDSNIRMCDEPALSLGQLRAKARRNARQFGRSKLIVVDYLGLMTMPKADRHDLSVGMVTRGLKELAKELRTPILLLVQANRATDKQSRPDMSNLKDSGAIEADADLIMFVHRREVQDEDTEYRGVTEIIIAKDRHGDGNGVEHVVKTGRQGFQSLHHEELARIENLEQQRISPIAKPRKKVDF